MESVLVTGRQKVEAAWVETYHETGRLIAEHLLLNEDRADYGAKTIARLAEDSGVSRRVLYQCVQFYRRFPIVHARAQLGWVQYRLLCEVEDPAQRRRLENKTRQHRWTGRELEARVRGANAARAATLAPSPADPEKTTAPVRLLRPRRGTAGLYRVIRRDGGLAVDAGFKLYRPGDVAQGRPPPEIKAGMIVRWADGVFTPVPDATAADLFTYRVKVRRVVDGDTLLVSVLLPGYEMDEKLRLRGLDCPELDTPEGKAAKRFVETLLATAAEIIITTAKVDKYDRYLADVFIRGIMGEGSGPGGAEVYLNNDLLAKGHAVPMGAEAMEEWVP